MECSRGKFDLTGQQGTVLAVSQPTKLEMQPGVSGLSDYFTLVSRGLKGKTCENEILSFWGRTNLKVLMNTVSESLYHIAHASKSSSSRQEGICPDSLQVAKTCIILEVQSQRQNMSRHRSGTV